MAFKGPDLKFDIKKDDQFIREEDCEEPKSLGTDANMPVTRDRVKTKEPIVRNSEDDYL